MCFSSFFCIFGLFWASFGHKFDQKCRQNGTKLIAHLSKKNSLGKPNHQPRHQFLTTSASPPAPNQQGLANFPDLPMSSSPTLPSEWAGGGSGSAGSIRRAPLRARRVRPLCRSCGTPCRRPDMLVMSLSLCWAHAIRRSSETIEIVVFPRRGSHFRGSGMPKPHG